jgi:hypothetical protein
MKFQHISTSFVGTLLKKTWSVWSSMFKKLLGWGERPYPPSYPLFLREPTPPRLLDSSQSHSAIFLTKSSQRS